MTDRHEFEGKKIVFVHPPDLVRGPLMELLGDREYEVYMLMEQARIPHIYRAYPDTVFFINIDTALTETEWQAFIRNLNENCPDILIGILSFRISEPSQIQPYIMDLGIRCGFIQLKQGVKAAGEMMLKVLNANEVKGRRKYLRYQCRREDQAVVRFHIDEGEAVCRIQDISSVGMSCVPDGPVSLVRNQLVRNIQMRLKGVIVSCDAILMGTRSLVGQEDLYVFLFRMDKTDKMRSRIRSYIYTSFQRQFDRDFGTHG